MGSPSEPTVSDEAAPIQESLEPARALTENGIEKATISNEHREMTLSPLELAQASEVFPERLTLEVLHALLMYSTISC